MVPTVLPGLVTFASNVQAEVEHLGGAALGDDFGRLEVATHDTFAYVRRRAHRRSGRRFRAVARVRARPSPSGASGSGLSISITRNCSSPSSAISWMVQMLGWFRAEAARAARDRESTPE